MWAGRESCSEGSRTAVSNACWRGFDLTSRCAAGGFHISRRELVKRPRTCPSPKLPEMEEGRTPPRALPLFASSLVRMAHQQHVERGLTFEQVKPLVEGERYANLVPPLPTTSLTYEQMEELIELRDTVAYALLAHSTLTPEVQELCDGVLEGSEAYRKILADSRRQRWGKPWESKRRPRSSKAFLDQFKVNVASSDRPLGEVSWCPAGFTAAPRLTSEPPQLMMAPTYSRWP